MINHVVMHTDIVWRRRIWKLRSHIFSRLIAAVIVLVRNVYTLLSASLAVKLHSLSRSPLRKASVLLSPPFWYSHRINMICARRDCWHKPVLQGSYCGNCRRVTSWICGKKMFCLTVIDCRWSSEFRYCRFGWLAASRPTSLSVHVWFGL